MTIRKISTETHLRGRLSDLGINQRPLQRGRPLIHLIQRMNGQERRPPVHLIPRINRQEEAVAIPSILNRIANERIVEMRARVAARRPLTNERIMALREFAALREDIDGQIIELRELRERNETIIAGIVSAHAVGLIADMYLGFRY